MRSSLCQLFSGRPVLRIPHHTDPCFLCLFSIHLPLFLSPVKGQVQYQAWGFEQGVKRACSCSHGTCRGRDRHSPLSTLTSVSWVMLSYRPHTRLRALQWPLWWVLNLCCVNPDSISSGENGVCKGPEVGQSTVCSGN